MRKVLFILVVLSIIFTTGCWDMIEINQRIFPYSVGIDLNREVNSPNKLNIIFVYPNIGALGKNPTSDKKEFMLSTHANNIFDAVHRVSTNTQQPIYLKHLKTLIISEEIAKDNKLVREIIDGLNRDYVLNKMINLLATKETSEEFIETKVKSIRQEDIEGIAYTLLRNDQKSIRFTPKTLNTFIKDMDISSTSIIPLGVSLGGEIDILGGAVFKDYGLVGYISPEENKSIALINGHIRETEINIDYRGANLSLLIMNTKSKKKLIDDKDQLKIRYSVELEGQINGYIMSNEQLSNSEENIEDMERAVEEVVEKELKAILKRLQGELNADVIGISEYLYKFHPKIWNEIQEEWDEVFPDLNIEIDVDMKIRRRGLVTW